MEDKAILEASRKRHEGHLYFENLKILSFFQEYDARFPKNFKLYCIVFVSLQMEEQKSLQK